jgi:CRP-like cAMP-binding protein
MALVDSMARSADVIADDDTEVLAVDAAALDRLRRRFPFTGVKLFQNLARILSKRLRATTQAVVAAELQPAKGAEPSR